LPHKSYFAIAGMVFTLNAKTMNTQKRIISLILCSGIALFFWALASRAITSDKVTLRVSPAGVEFQAEGSQK
jgi:uncharacterized membrane protein YgdD (TMEM256/DUF423 family)